MNSESGPCRSTGSKREVGSYYCRCHKPLWAPTLEHTNLDVSLVGPRAGQPYRPLPPRCSGLAVVQNCRTMDAQSKHAFALWFPLLLGLVDDSISKLPSLICQVGWFPNRADKMVEWFEALDLVRPWFESCPILLLSKLGHWRKSQQMASYREKD